MPLDTERDKDSTLLDAIRQKLQEHRRNRTTGRLTIELELYQGGVNKRWIEISERIAVQ